MIQKVRRALLENRSPAQTMLKNLFWLSSSQVTRLLRSLALLYSARVLGASEYGAFSYILSLVGIYTIVSDFGINSLMVRDAARHPEMRAEYLSTSLALKFLLSLLACVLFVILTPRTTQLSSVVGLIPLTCVLIFADNLRDLVIAFLRGAERMEGETLITALLNFLFAALTVFFIRSEPTAHNLFVLYLISSVCTAGLAIYFVRGFLISPQSSRALELVKETLRSGFPIALSGAFSLLMLNMDVIMLEHWRSANEIGLYAAGQRVLQFLITVPTLLGIAAFPILASEAKNPNSEKGRTLTESLMTLTFMYSFPLLVGGLITAQSLFLLLFGHGYSDGVPAFSVLLVNSIFIFPSCITANLLIAHKLQQKALPVVIVATVINVVFNCFWIPRYGIVGAAMATLLSQAFNFLASVILLRRHFDFNPVGHLAKTLISIVLMAAACQGLMMFELHVLLVIAVSAGIYILALVGMREKQLMNVFALFLNNK